MQRKPLTLSPLPSKEPISRLTRGHLSLCCLPLTLSQQKLCAGPSVCLVLKLLRHIALQAIVIVCRFLLWLLVWVCVAGDGQASWHSQGSNAFCSPAVEPRLAQGAFENESSDFIWSSFPPHLSWLMVDWRQGCSNK